MKIIRQTSQFKKDFKRFQHDRKKVEALMRVVSMLANDETLPSELKAHPLSGSYKDYLECHIGADYLLIWYDRIENTIELVRLGSHSELFK